MTRKKRNFVAGLTIFPTLIVAVYYAALLRREILWIGLSRSDRATFWLRLAVAVPLLVWAWVFTASEFARWVQWRRRRRQRRRWIDERRKRAAEK